MQSPEIRTESSITFTHGREAKGVCLLLERLPLVVKILMVSSISVVGMLLFGISFLAVMRSNFTNYSQTLQMASIINTTRAINNALAVERHHSVNSTNSNIANVRRETDVILLARISKYQVSKSDPYTIVMQDFLNTLPAQIETIRAQVDKFASKEQIMEAYANLTNVIHRHEGKFCTVMEEMKACLIQNFHSIMMEQIALHETASTLYSNASVKSMAHAVAIFAAVERLIQVYSTSTSVTLADYANLQMTTEDELLKGMPTATANATAIIAAQRAKLSTSMEMLLLSSTVTASSSLGIGVAFVVFCSLLILAFFICSCCVTFTMSRTITGPWQRLNELLTETIERFVPKDLLGAMKIQKIADLKPGYEATRTLTVVHLEIGNYSKLPAMYQSVTMINQFYNWINPVILRNGGFLFKYMPEGCVVLFNKTSRSIRAVKELFTSMNQFREQYPHLPALRLVAGVCTDSCILGAVGEAKRINVECFSPAMHLAHHFCKLNKLYQTEVLGNTASVVKCAARLVGKVYCNKQYVDAHQIFLKDEAQVVELYEGLELLFTNKFEVATEHFANLLKQHPMDAQVERLHSIASTLLDTPMVQKLPMNNVMQDNILFTYFKEYCSLEKSYENILALELIDAYYNAPQVDRIAILAKLKKDYIETDCLNLNDKFKQEFVHELSASALPDACLQKLQTQVETVLFDTYKRFKISDACTSAQKRRHLMLLLNGEW